MVIRFKEFKSFGKKRGASTVAYTELNKINTDSQSELLFRLDVGLTVRTKKLQRHEVLVYPK